MRLRFAIAYAFKNLKRHKLRTFLTASAVLIGTMLVSSMVSLGVGLQRFVVEGIKGAGELTDINVYQENEEGEAMEIPPEKISAIEGLEGVEYVEPMVTLVAEAVSLSGFEKQAGQTLITAVSGQNSSPFELVAGTNFSQNDYSEVVLGEEFIKTFSQDYPENFIGRSVNLVFGEKEFSAKIVGVAKGENIMSYGLFIPLGLASQIKERASYDSLRVKAARVQDVAGISTQIQELGLQTVTLDSLVSQITKYFRILQLALGSFGIIIIGVASLSIINTMIMAILERTREIGVMRAVGASRRDIIKVFSFEAGAIGFLGGVFGISLGRLIAFGFDTLINQYLTQQNIIQTEVHLFVTPWWLVLGLLAFATLVGMCAGLYPAIRASRLDPVEALRRE